MKPFKKVQRKLERRLRQHSEAMTVARAKATSQFNPAAYKTPGSRNPHKT